MALEKPERVESGCAEPFRQSVIAPISNCGSVPTRPIAANASIPSVTIPLYRFTYGTSVCRWSQPEGFRRGRAAAAETGCAIALIGLSRTHSLNAKNAATAEKLRRGLSPQFRLRCIQLRHFR